MTHSMVTFLGGLGGLLFALVISNPTSLGRCVIMAIAGAIIGFAIYPVGSKIKFKVRKN